MGKSVFKTPNQGEDSSFCYWMAWSRLAQKERSFHRHWYCAIYVAKHNTTFLHQHRQKYKYQRVIHGIVHMYASLSLSLCTSLSLSIYIYIYTFAQGMCIITCRHVPEYNAPLPTVTCSHAPVLGIHYRGMQWEEGAVDGGSIT